METQFDHLSLIQISSLFNIGDPYQNPDFSRNSSQQPKWWQLVSIDDSQKPYTILSPKALRSLIGNTSGNNP